MISCKNWNKLKIPRNFQFIPIFTWNYVFIILILTIIVLHIYSYMNKICTCLKNSLKSKKIRKNYRILFIYWFYRQTASKLNLYATITSFTHVQIIMISDHFLNTNLTFSKLFHLIILKLTHIFFLFQINH